MIPVAQKVETGRPRFCFAVFSCSSSLTRSTMSSDCFSLLQLDDSTRSIVSPDVFFLFNPEGPGMSSDSVEDASLQWELFLTWARRSAKSVRGTLRLGGVGSAVFLVLPGLRDEGSARLMSFFSVSVFRVLSFQSRPNKGGIWLTMCLFCIV